MQEHLSRNLRVEYISPEACYQRGARWHAEPKRWLYLVVLGAGGKEGWCNEWLAGARGHFGERDGWSWLKSHYGVRGLSLKKEGRLQKFGFEEVSVEHSNMGNLGDKKGFRRTVHPDLRNARSKDLKTKRVWAIKHGRVKREKSQKKRSGRKRAPTPATRRHIFLRAEGNTLNQAGFCGVFHHACSRSSLREGSLR